MHRLIERQLSAYLDRELRPDEEGAVARHLQECASCRTEFDRLRQTKTFLSSLAERPLPDDFWPQMRRRLHQESRPRPSWLAPVFQRPAAALAGMAALILLLLLPLARVQLDRLRAAEFGYDLFVREHAVSSAVDPLADRAYLGFLVSDADLSLVGEEPEEQRR
jgi:anti-sigma factor RsiW